MNIFYKKCVFQMDKYSPFSNLRGVNYRIVDLFPPNIFHPAVATFYVDTLYHSRAAYVKMWIIMKMKMKNTAPSPLAVSPKTAYSKGRGS